MPTGVYRTMDGEGKPTGREEFRCAPGPAGWRYVSTIHVEAGDPHIEIVDLAVDDTWRPVRLRVDTGEHDLLVNSAGDKLRGARDGERVELDWRDDVDYLSPCFNLATARRLGRTAEVQVLYFQPRTLTSSMVAQRYELLGDETVATPAGRFDTTAWRYTAVESGFTRKLWIAGDVLIDYEGVFQLEALEPGPQGPFPL
ncbi:MAG TPA: putative glycolipid-binding domain-containing protein [Actinomycetota bacterium]|nr:putative glycolipid-binding domain-containing protein [Actinomycetota bacterium]